MIVLVTVLCGVLFSGCGKESVEESLVVYSFCGANEIFSISNGVIVLSSAEEIFYGGNLNGELSDVVAYTMTFYILVGNDEQVLLSNSVTDETGGAISIAGEVGKRTDDMMTTTEIEELKNNLYFELETINVNGEKTSICYK